jgi:hypothetical protein
VRFAFLLGANDQHLGQIATFIDRCRQTIVDELQRIERIWRSRHDPKRIEHDDAVSECLPPVCGSQLEILSLEIDDDRRFLARLQEGNDAGNAGRTGLTPRPVRTRLLTKPEG